MNYNLLREQRRKLGFTQMQIANILGVSEITVKSWECGKIGAKSSRLKDICKVYQVELVELLK